MSLEPTSSLDAEDIKARNHRFWVNPDHTYETLVSESQARRSISNVRNHDLRRVLRTLPEDRPVYQQAAYWTRALVGKHFFPDANHRTAMLTLKYLLDENDIAVPSWPGSNIQSTIYDSKKARRDIVTVTFDNLWEKDELYAVWCRHFAKLLEPPT